MYKRLYCVHSTAGRLGEREHTKIYCTSGSAMFRSLVASPFHCDVNFVLNVLQAILEYACVCVLWKRRPKRLLPNRKAQRIKQNLSSRKTKREWGCDDHTPAKISYFLFTSHCAFFLWCIFHLFCVSHPTSSVCMCVCFLHTRRRAPAPLKCLIVRIRVVGDGALALHHAHTRHAFLFRLRRDGVRLDNRLL